jgi:hypothetical protein
MAALLGNREDEIDHERAGIYIVHILCVLNNKAVMVFKFCATINGQIKLIRCNYIV